MARHTSPPPPPQPAVLTATQIRQGIARLEKRLAEVKQFEPTSVREQFNAPHLRALSAGIDDSLVRTFGNDTVDYLRYKPAAQFDQGPINLYERTPINRVHVALLRSKGKSVALLKQAIRTLGEHLDEIGDAPAAEELTDGPSRTTSAKPSKKVFVVHGHDGEPKQAVARFLESLGFEPVILHEQANGGAHHHREVREECRLGFRGGPPDARR